MKNCAKVSFPSSHIHERKRKLYKYLNIQTFAKFWQLNWFDFEVRPKLFNTFYSVFFLEMEIFLHFEKKR